MTGFDTASLPPGHHGPFAIRGQIMTGGEASDGVLVIEEGRIVELRREPKIGDLSMPVLKADLVGPGLIDLQVNGGFGVEVNDGPEALQLLSRRLPEHGVTAYLPTLITSPTAAYSAFFEQFATAHPTVGARRLGIHLEGPFLAPAYKGAHRLDWIEQADSALLELFLGNDDVKLVTLAPERAGGLDRIRRLAERGIVVSLGHTAAGYEEFVGGIDGGATMATHLFNAMSPFAHRAPGAVGAALLDDRVTVGLIADGVHVHPAAVALAVRARSTGGIALVSDLMSAAGMPDGTYALGGRSVQVTGASARLADGTLAGAVTPLVACVRNVAAWAGISPAVAWQMASEIPAGVLGDNKRGRIAVGLDADLVLLDASLEVQATMICGEIVCNPTRVRDTGVQ